MTKHEATLKAHAELLISALVDTNNALVKFEVLSNEEDVHKNTRLAMKKSMSDLKQTVNRFHRFWGVEGKKVVEAQVLNDGASLQIQEITHGLIELNEQDRNIAEEFINKLKNKNV